MASLNRPLSSEELQQAILHIGDTVVRSFQHFTIVARDTNYTFENISKAFWNLYTPAQRRAYCKRMIRDAKWNHYMEKK